MFPTIMEKIIESIDEISLTQWSQIKNGEEYDRVRTLVTINQSLLNSMGAGHHAIDDILQVASGLDLAGKLTGAGGGGTVLILLRPGIFEIKLKKTQFYFEQL